MAETNRGIGRGLAAILTAGESGLGDLDLRALPVELITPNPRQPRRSFDQEALAALAESLSDRGILQPVLVRPLPGGTYELIAGERRWRAAQLAGLETVPAMVRPHDDAESLELALIENMARQDLNPIEEARACAALVEELGLTRDEIGRRVGRSRVAVSNLIRLLDLPDEAVKLIETRALTEGHGRALLLAGDHGIRRTLARDAAAANWTVRETETRARAAMDTSSASRREAGRPQPHPDQLAAAAELSDLFSRAVGNEVRVKAHSKGYQVSLAFGSLDEAFDLAARLTRPAAA